MHKILLVEDDQVIRQQVGKLLSEWGFEVVLVEDFMEVLSLLSSQNLIWSSWILACHSLMVTTGARKFVRFPRYLSCFCLREIRLWISSWQSIWERMTL